jgi:hypothetical protein
VPVPVPVPLDLSAPGMAAAAAPDGRHGVQVGSRSMLSCRLAAETSTLSGNPVA